MLGRRLVTTRRDTPFSLTECLWRFLLKDFKVFLQTLYVRSRGFVIFRLAFERGAVFVFVFSVSVQNARERKKVYLICVYVCIWYKAREKMTYFCCVRGSASPEKHFS